MTFHLVHQASASTNARSPFRIVEQHTGREVTWINRFLDRERVRRLADTTLRSYALDLLHFVRWWASVHQTAAVTEDALTGSTLRDYVRFQSGQQPRPAAASINRRSFVIDRALCCPGLAPQCASAQTTDRDRRSPQFGFGSSSARNPVRLPRRRGRQGVYLTAQHPGLCHISLARKPA